MVQRGRAVEEAKDESGEENSSHTLEAQPVGDEDEDDNDNENQPPPTNDGGQSDHDADKPPADIPYGSSEELGHHGHTKTTAANNNHLEEGEKLLW